jgi:uncharacterized membrane protein
MMTLLASWAAIWILIHRLISGGPLRSWLVASVGERLYRMSFALLSVVCLAGMANAYANVKPIGSAAAPWLVVVVALIQLFATTLFIAGLSTRNPTTAGMGQSVHEPDIVHGMVRVTRHPFLWGILLWSAGHLVVRHDPPALLFFGSIAVVAAMGMWSIDRKRRLASGAAWLEFSRKTSLVPFLAIAAGRQPFVLSEIGLWRVVVAVTFWFAMLWLHPYFGSGFRLFPTVA